MLNQALILCGGIGSRLGCLTRSTPKPLLEVGGRPFLDFLLFQLGRHGVRDVTLLAGYRADQVARYIENNDVARQFGMRIKLSVEPVPSGTAGAIRHAGSDLNSIFLLLNGDSWFDFNLLSLPAGLPPEADAALALRRIPDTTHSGQVELKGNLISRFWERPRRGGPGIANAGVYLLRKQLLSSLPKEGSLEGQVLPELAAAGRLYGVLREGYFIDIGLPDSYLRAKAELPDRLIKPAVFLDRDGVVNHDDKYVGCTSRFRWIDGAREAIRDLNESGFYVFIVTNQAGVAHGYYTEGDVKNLHEWMMVELAGIGAHVDDIRYCPYHPRAKVAEYRKVSSWRKPGPGMVADLIARWPVDVGRSHIVGDRWSDLCAGRAAGLSAHLFKGGNLSDFLRAAGIVTARIG